MRRPSTILLAAAVSAVALYGLTKAAMYLRVKDTMDDLVIAAATYGKLSYGGIEIDVTGRVGVKDIAFEPDGIDGSLRVAKLTVSGPDAWFFIRPDRLWGEERQPMPPRLRAYAEGVEVPVDPAWAVGPSGAPETTHPDGCAAGAPLSDPDLLAALGLERIVVDADMGWDLDEAARRLDADFGFDLQGLQSMRTRVSLTNVTLAALQERAVMPELGGFEVSFRLDPTFGQRFVEICAERRGISLETFRAELANEQLAALENAGVNLGAGLRHAMKTFYAQWGEVRLAARPESPIGVMSLMFLSPDHLVDALALDLRVNNLVVTDLGVSLQAPDGAAPDRGLAAIFDRSQAGGPPPQALRPRYETRWVTVSPTILAGHLNRDVRLYLSDQPPRIGRLINIADGVVEVEQRVHGGHFTAHVRLAEIARAEVEVRRLVQPVANSTAQ